MVMGDAAFYVTLVGGILSLGASVWYYSVLGKKIKEEEQKEGKDLTHEINPFTGSTDSNTESKKEQ